MVLEEVTDDESGAIPPLPSHSAKENHPHNDHASSGKEKKDVDVKKTAPVAKKAPPATSGSQKSMMSFFAKKS